MGQNSFSIFFQVKNVYLGFTKKNEQVVEGFFAVSSYVGIVKNKKQPRFVDGWREKTIRKITKKRLKKNYAEFRIE